MHYSQRNVAESILGGWAQDQDVIGGKLEYFKIYFWLIRGQRS